MIKQKRLLIILLIFLPVFAFVFFSLSPRKYQRYIEVPISSDQIVSQLTVASNISKWYYPFSSVVTGAGYEDSTMKKLISGEYSLTINKTAPQKAYYTVGRWNRMKNFLFTVVPGDMGTTKVLLTYRSSPVSRWLGKNDLELHAEKSLDQLKKRLNDSLNTTVNLVQ